jgi:hypothetical protein
MPPTGKRKAPPADAAAPKQHGGGGRRQGRKKAQRILGGEQGMLACKQASIMGLLGARTKPAAAAPEAANGGEAAAPVADNAGRIRWHYMRHDGGANDTVVPQELGVSGYVEYDHFEYRGRRGQLLAKGTEEDVFYMNADSTGEEVDASHPNAIEHNRRGSLQLKFDGEAP